MIYFDNAATTFPKPKRVGRRMKHFLERSCANPGRGGHKLSRIAGRKVTKARQNLAKFLGIEDPLRLIFTFNDTLALNMGIHGVLRPGDHVITTVYEHNSILRPLMKLSKTGVEVSILDGNMNGEISLEQLMSMIKGNTKMVAICISSNVLGNILPVAEIGRICRETGKLLLVDGAQGVGTLPIDVEKMCIDLLAFPGHKGLYGPMGTGGLYIGERANVDDVIQGGTGTVSENIEQPDTFPDRYESGTSNAVGIWGLNAGLEFVKGKGIKNIKKHEDKLTNILIKGLSDIKGVKILGEDMKERMPIVAFNIGDMHSTKAASILDKKYNIATRGGLHCAGLFHRMAGTIKQGAVRVSPGYFNTKEEAYKFIKAVREIAKKQ